MSPDNATTAKNALIKAINAAKPDPVHESCIYAFGPYVEWIRALGPTPSTTALHLRQSAEQLGFALHHDGHKKELRALAMFLLSLALEEKESP